MKSNINLLMLIFFVALFTSCSSGHNVYEVRNVPREDNIVTVNQMVTVNQVPDNLIDVETKELLDKVKSNENDVIDSQKDLIKNIAQTSPVYDIEDYLKTFPDADLYSINQFSVGPGDIISIKVYGEDEMTRDEIRVSHDGYITFPFIGRVYLYGLNTSQIEKVISKKLVDGGYFLDAQVTVLIKEQKNNYYQVLGAVRATGKHPYRLGEKIIDAISNAGGVDPETAGKELLIIRSHSKQIVNKTGLPPKVILKGDINALLEGSNFDLNIAIWNKDILYIPKAAMFYIMGQVSGPGSYKFLKKDMTIVEAISSAGGFTSKAARRKTRIIRVENGNEIIITVDVDKITDSGFRSEDVMLKPNDIIVVPESMF